MLLIVISEMRKAAKVADEHNDPGTVDLFSKSVQIHEKHEWFLRDILRTGDGLTELRAATPNSQRPIPTPNSHDGASLVLGVG